MPVGQAEEIFALGLVFVVHVIGGLMLVWALLDEEQRAGWRRRWGGGDGGPDDPSSQPGGGGGGRAPLPLPGAEPSVVRLREPVRAAEAYPRPPRRPAHPPHPRQPRREPAPAPERPGRR